MRAGDCRISRPWGSLMSAKENVFEKHVQDFEGNKALKKKSGLAFDALVVKYIQISAKAWDMSVSRSIPKFLLPPKGQASRFILFFRHKLVLIFCLRA